MGMVLVERCNQTLPSEQWTYLLLPSCCPYAVLRVLEVQQPTQPVTSIDVEGNNISIPTEVFVNPSNEAGQR